jgi:2-polyprenyl-6-hydroxyphenyl methylase/3-demethylubiquinone-9 3-methyltransferase
MISLLSRTVIQTIHRNFDPEEIAKFEAAASCWWDPEGRLKALHDINGLRIGYLLSRTELAGKSVLDVGCGGGLLSEGLAAQGARVTGIDLGEAPLAAARRHLSTSGYAVDYLRSSAEQLAETGAASFDSLVCFELLEHVPEPSSIFSACSRLVKPGGDLFFATLNRNFKSFIFAIVGAEYLLGLVPKGTHTFRRFIKPSEMKLWAQAAGLELQNMTGLHYNPFSKRYSLGGSLHVNYFSHFRRPVDRSIG